MKSRLIRPTPLLFALAAILASLCPAPAYSNEVPKARSSLLAEANLERFAGAGGGVLEGVEWHAGRLLWHASREGGWAAGARAGGLLPEGWRSAPDDEIAALLAPVLAAAYAAPGQRFHRSPRVAAVLRGMAQALAAAPSPASGSGGPVWAEREKALALAAVLWALDGSSGGRWHSRMVSALRARAESPPACAPGLAWRARALFALACLEGDQDAATEAARDMRHAIQLAAGEEGAFDPARVAFLAADALALAEWSRGTGFALGHAEADWGLEQARKVARWGWAGDRLDPLLAPDAHEADSAAWAFLEAAFRVRDMVGPLPGGALGAGETARGWTRREGPLPSPAAARALALWPDREEGAAPPSPGGWLASPGGTFVVRTGPEGRWSFRGVARRGGEWVPDGEEGWFNLYSGQRAEGLRAAAEAGFRPGGLRGGGFGSGVALGDARLALATPAAEDGMGRMASLRLASGAAWLQARRAWAAFPQGLAFSVAGVDGRSARTVGTPWVCAPGRDRAAWLEVRLPGREGFDVLRLFIAPERGTWRGMPRRARVLVSDDRTNWAVVADVPVPFDRQEEAPAVAPVSIPFDRVEARNVRIAFPGGGAGGTVRVLEVELRRTVRDAAGLLAGESEDLALASRGATVAAESSASPDHPARLVINGVRDVSPAPLGEVALGLFVAPAGGRLVLGLEDEREDFVLPPGVPSLRVEGVRWAHDGAAGFAFSRPATLVVERLGGGWMAGSAVLGGEDLGVFGFPGGEPEDAERAADGGVAWRTLSSNAVHVELAGEGLGFLAAFDAFRNEAAEAEEPCCLLYRRSGNALAVHADWQRRSRVGLAVPGVRRATVNGEEVPVEEGDWVVLPLGASALEGACAGGRLRWRATLRRGRSFRMHTGACVSLTAGRDGARPSKSLFFGAVIHAPSAHHRV